jgi:hypothetical protein
VSRRFRYGAVRVENEFHWRALIKIGVALRRLLERDHLRIDDVRDWNAIVQDRLQELTIIAQDWRLTRVEGMRFRPAETEWCGPRAACCARLLEVAADSLLNAATEATNDAR